MRLTLSLVVVPLVGGFGAWALSGDAILGLVVLLALAIGGAVAHWQRTRSPR